jgi:hypothetical protein
MTKGYIRIPQAFTTAQADDVIKDVWVRLGMDPDDKSTWDREWINMPCTLAIILSFPHLMLYPVIDG